MAINPNNGVLDIINGTLRVTSLDVKQGSSVSLNALARNNVLLFDDQKSTTTFMPTVAGGYMSSTGVTRNTTAGYLELGTASDEGWVYWPLQLPNAWHAEFDMHVTTTGGVLTFSLFNTSEPNHTDFTNNDGGYKIVFDNTNNQIVIYWEGSVHKTVSASLRSNDWQHVNVNYSQGATSISLAGKVVLTHEFTQNYQEFNSRYVGFSATAGTSHKIRHLRVHNGDKWLYTKTSNASDITYVSGNVGIGSLAPTELLDVHGNVHIAKDLTVDGNLRVSGTTTFIDSTNLVVEDPIIELAKGNTSDTIDAGLIVTRGASNVAIAFRGDEEELAFGYTQSGASGTDVTPIANGGLDVRVYGNLFANNLTTTANVDASYINGNVVTSNLMVSGEYTMGGRIIPDTNDAYDIGSAEKKIRDLYVSDNSLWIGDETKISFASGKMRFRKRKKNVVPAAILAAGGTATAAKTFSSKANLTDIKTHEWLNYMKTLGGKGNAIMSDVFRNNDDDYEATTAAEAWKDINDDIFSESNVSIGKTSSPTVTLDVEGDGKFSGNVVTTGNIGIRTATPSANLHVVGHQYINDPPTLANAFDHSDAPLTLTHDTATSSTAIDDPKAVLHLTRDGTSGESYGARASFNLSRYENSGTASRSRLDVALTDGTYAETNVMTLRADGKVGIGTDSPGYTLDVNGDINLSGDFYQGGSPFVSSLWTSGNDSLYYTTNNVGIGTNTAEYTLDVHGNANVGALTTTSVSGDGSALYGIQSSNVSDFASNVTRITNLETSNGHIWSNLESNVTTLRSEMASNTVTLRGDLQSNVTTLRSEMASNTVALRGDLQSNVTTLRDTAITFTGIKTFQNDVILESNLRVQGDLLVANTVNMTVSDPILELGSNNQNTGDIGLVMTRHGTSNSNVAVFFDETADALKLGYTLNGANDTTLELDSNALAVSVQGALTAASVSGDGSGLTSLNASKITSGTLGRPISTTTGVFTSTGNALLVGTDGKLGLTINDGDGNCNLTFNHASMVPDKNGSSGRIDCGVDGTTGYMRLRVKSNVTGGSSIGALPDCLRIQEAYVRSYGDFYADGNVGIGTTTPGRPLEIAADGGGAILNLKRTDAGTGQGALAFVNLNSNVCASVAATRTGAEGGNLVFYTIPDDTTLTSANPYLISERMRITSGGNVGIGTTSPARPLTIESSSFDGIRVKRTIAGGGSAIELINGNDDEWTVGVGGTGTFGIYDGATFGEQFAIDTSGNVGIGTTSPDYQLDIHNDDKAQMRLKSNKTSGDGDAILYLDSSQTGESDIDFMHDGVMNWRLRTGDASGTNFQIHDSGDASRFAIKQDGNVGIGVTSPTSPLHIVGSDTNANATYSTMVIDHNCSGSDACTTDRLHTGLLVDMDSTATGGDTNHEHRMYGIRSDTRHSGDSDLVYGLYSYTRSDHTSGTTTNLRAGDFYAVASGTGTNTNIHGINSFAYKDAGSTGTTANMYGVRGEVEVDAGTCTNAYAFQAHIDRDDGTITTGYLYYGSYSGTVGTKYGVYVTGETKNYFSGDVGIGTSSPGYKLDVNGTLHAKNSYFDNIYIGGSTSRGLRAVSGNYGTVQTTGGGAGAWEGYSIDGRYVFMSADNNRCGIYNDLDNEWMIYCYRNSYVKLYYNGGVKLETLGGGVKIHGSLTATGNVTAYSDIRHKKDIVKLDNALEKVEKLNGYTYTRKDDDKRYTGLIAQEVLEVLPEAVIADEKGEYSLAYGNMAGLFVEAMKEMKSKLDTALARLDALENPH